MNLKEEYLQSLYQTERIIKQTKGITVEIVKNTQTGDLFVKKTLTDKSLGEIYHVLKKLDHIHIVKVMDIFEFKMAIVIIEEYIQGQNMSEQLKMPIDEKTVINWIEQISSALEFLHSQFPPIIHRDLKPSNIMLQRGQIILIDFDIARSVKHDAGKDTRLIGTSGYAPPEQYGFAQTDTRSDIYALGILFQECLQGKTKKWDAIIKKCTAIDPINRYQTVGEVVAAIKGRERHSNKFILLLSMAVVVVIAGFSVFINMFSSTLPDAISKPVVTLVESLPDETLRPIVTEAEPSDATVAASVSQLESDSSAAVAVSSEDNKTLLYFNKKGNKSTRPSAKEQEEFFKAHKVIYPQFEKFPRVSIEINSILEDLKARKISPERGARCILDLRNEVRLMSEVLSISMTSDPTLNRIILRWSSMLESDVHVLENIYIYVLEGRYEEAALANVAAKRDEKAAGMMNRYAAVQNQYDLP